MIEQTFDSKGREIVKFLIPLNEALSGNFPPPYEPPDGMKYSAYNDYESGIARMTYKNRPLSQSTNSTSPCTGMGSLIIKMEAPGHQVDNDIYIGIATEEQRQNYPNDPSHWEARIRWDASAIEPNILYWVGFYFLDESQYIDKSNLYSMMLGKQTFDTLAIYGWITSGSAGSVYPNGKAYYWDGNWEQYDYNGKPQDYAFFFYTIEEPQPTCTANFQENSAEIGDTIHADFTWTDAVYINSPGAWYARMRIYDPGGNVAESWIEYTTGSPSGSHSLSHIVDSDGTWTAEIEVWDGSQWLTCTDTLTSSSPPASGSTNFQEISATIGDTIHTNSSWSNARRSTPGAYASMYIYRPDGSNCAEYAEMTDSTGAHTLSCTADIAGDWTAELIVWNGSTWLKYTDTLMVSGPSTCTNPPGNNGQIECGAGDGNQPDPTHKYKCVNGAWVDQGYDSSCEEPLTCTNPPGNNGQIECGAGDGNQPDPTHKYKCVNGAWVDQGYDSSCEINYLPYIIIGAGGVLLLIALLAKRE